MNGLAHAYSGARKLAARWTVRVATFAVIALVAKWPMLAAAAMLNDFRDAHYFTLFEEAARLSVAKFHEAPLWDPYYCGGIYGLGTPSARFASPTFLLTLLFGTLRADPLIVFVMTILGMEGAYRYARARGGSVLGAVLAAPVFSLSGLFAVSESFGWINFFGFQLLPWALLGIRRALRGSRRGAVLAALAVAWMIGLGGTYSGPLTALAAAVEVLEALLAVARTPRRMVRVVAMAALVVVLAAALGAVRLWPVAETLASAPRILGGKVLNAPWQVWRLLVGESLRSLDAMSKGDFLIGAAVVPVLAVGCVRKRSWPLLGAGFLWLWFATGYERRPSIFAVLRHIPPYTMLRAPERFLVLFALVAATLAAVGVRRIEAAARRRPGWVLAATGALGLLAFDVALLVRNDRNVQSARAMVIAPEAVDREFRQARGNRWLAAHYPWMSRGTLSCFDDYEVPQAAALRGDLTSEERLDDEAAGRVERRSWQPNRIDLHVDLNRPARILVNQNWHPGWRSSTGDVVDDNGLLAVDAPAGTYDLSLRFLPRSALGGLATTLAALAVAFVIARRSRREDTVQLPRPYLRDLGLAFAPFAVALAAFLVVREPARPPPVLVTPDGEPMVVEAPPPDATPIGASWGHGAITLQGARLVTSQVGDSVDVSLELDWRIERALPEGLGVFIHFEAPFNEGFNTDHVLLSGTVPLENAPLHKTLRDVLATIAVPRAKKAGVWKGYAGLWYARRNGERLAVTERGDAVVSDNRVYIGTFTVTK